MATVPTSQMERELRKLYLQWLGGLSRQTDISSYIDKFERDSVKLISKLGGQAASLGALADFPVPKTLELSPHAGTVYSEMKQAAIKASITAGINSKDAARQILNAGLDKSYKRLERLARTETVSAYWKNSWDSIADLPLLVMVWGSEESKRTCDYCLSRDGLVLDDGNIRDHPNGRCTPIPTLRSRVKYKGTLQPDGSVTQDPRWADQKVKGAKAKDSTIPTTEEQRDPISGKSNPAAPSQAQPVHQSTRTQATPVTVESISSELSVHFPNTKLVGWEQAASMHIDDLAAASKTLANLADKYPLLRELGEIRIESMGKNSVASANTKFAYDTLKRREASEIMRGSHVALSSSMSAEDLVKGAEASRKAGWWHISKGVSPVEYTVTHETGHLLDYATAQKTGRQATKLAKATGTEQSRYARRNSKEAVAEAFATMETSPAAATLADKAVYEYLMKQVADATP